MREGLEVGPSRSSHEQKSSFQWKPVMRLVDRSITSEYLTTPPEKPVSEVGDRLLYAYSTGSNSSKRSNDSPFDVYSNASKSNTDKFDQTIAEQIRQTPFDEDSIASDEHSAVQEDQSVVSACPSDEIPRSQALNTVDRQRSSEGIDSETSGVFFDDGLWDISMFQQLNEVAREELLPEFTSDEEIVLFNKERDESGEERHQSEDEEGGLFSYQAWNHSDEDKEGFFFKCSNMDQVPDLIAAVRTTQCIAHSSPLTENNDFTSHLPPAEISIPSKAGGYQNWTPPTMMPCELSQASVPPDKPHKDTPGDESGSISHYPRSVSTDPDSLMQMSLGDEEFETPVPPSRVGPRRIAKSTPSTLDFSDSLFDSIIDSRAPVADTRDEPEDHRDISDRVSGLLDPPDIVRKIVTRSEADPATRIMSAIAKRASYKLTAEKKKYPLKTEAPRKKEAAKKKEMQKETPKQNGFSSADESGQSQEIVEKDDEQSCSPSISSKSSSSPRPRRKWFRPFHRLHRVREDSVLDSLASSPQSSLFHSASEQSCTLQNASPKSCTLSNAYSNDSPQSASEALKGLVADTSLLDECSSQESRSFAMGSHLCTSYSPAITSPPKCNSSMIGRSIECADFPRDTGAPPSRYTVMSSDRTDESQEDDSISAGDHTMITPNRCTAVCHDVAEGWGLGEADSVALESQASSGDGEDEEEDFFRDLGTDIVETVEELTRESTRTMKWFFRWRKWRK